MSEYKVKKQDVFNNKELYYEIATYCKNNNCVLSEDNEYYIAITIPTPTFNEIKEAKYKEISNARYNEIENTGMEYTLYDDDNPNGLNVIVDTDSKAQGSITGQASASKLMLEQGIEDNSKSVLWKFRNQIWGYFSYTGFIQFSLLVCDWIEKRYAKEKLLVTKINECTTIEELEKISWDSTEPNE